MVETYQAPIDSFIVPETIIVFKIRPEYNVKDDLLLSMGDDHFFGTKYLLCKKQDKDIVGVIKYANYSYYAELDSRYDYERNGKDIIGGAIRAHIDFPDSYSETLIIDDEDYFKKFKRLLHFEIDVGVVTLHAVPGQNIEVSRVRSQKKKLFYPQGEYKI